MDIDNIGEAENLLISAIKNRDLNSLDKLLHEDLRFMVPGGEIITKEVDLTSHRKGEMEIERLIANIEDITIIGDNAVVVVVYDTKGTMLGNPIEGRYRYVRVWKMFPDGLKVIGGSCSGISNP